MSGSLLLERELASMEIGEERPFEGYTRSKVHSAVRLHCRRSIMQEIKSFAVFQRGGVVFAKRGDDL